GSLADGLPAIARAFEDYGVPYFVEKSTPLSEHPSCDFIVSFLDFSRRGLPAREFAKVVSSGLFIPDKKLADRLVNYVYSNAITRKAFKTPFIVEHENLKEFENIRGVVCQVEDKLSRAKTVADFVSSLRFLFQVANAEENLKSLTASLKKSNYPILADFNDRVFEKIGSLLSEMEYIMGDCQVTALEFKNLFLSGAVGTQISSIPILNDAVYVGECKDVKIKSAKILYAVCLNGDVPFTQSDTALLSDGDLSVLDGFDLIVEPKIKSVNQRERENVAVSLCSFTEKLKLSYSTEKVDGSKNFKSDAIKSLTDLFGLVPQTRTRCGDRLKSLTDGFANETTSLMELARSYPSFKLSEEDTLSKIASFYKATELLSDNLLKEKANGILAEKNRQKSIQSGENLSVSGAEISAGVLESYFSCPYKNYASNILKLQESPVLDVKVNETGSLLHKVNELYSDRMGEVSDKISSDALVSKIYEGLKDDKDFKKYSSTPKTKAVLDRLLKESKRVCYNIYSSLEKSQFKTLYQEVRFGAKGSLPPIELNAKSGSVWVKGIVDRVDGFNDYVRIIDYKSGKIDDSEESFYTGNKIQLYLYMNAFINDKVKPAGAYYYPVKDEFTKDGESYVMLGKTVLDNEILSATDSDILEGKSSKVVKVRLKADGEPYKYADVLSSDDMYKFIKYSKLLSANSVDEIRSGYIEPSPYEKACDYCAYGGMCGFAIAKATFIER
ncbi:MAG: PD-(D/E)XK nuclease family protein, partial [Clostridia bacterium]|nr:PD-(D/E)XK nuclease family protein [Clostridia bacterium]